MSGHIFIADNYLGFDDAIYAAVRVITQMVKGGQSITEFMDRFPNSTPRPSLHRLARHGKVRSMEKIRAHVLSDMTRRM